MKAAAAVLAAAAWGADYRDTPVQPWSGYRVHDAARPAPPRVTAEPDHPPSDAVVLFDGRDLSRWRPSRWKIEDGVIQAGEGNLISRREFGDCQIHLEWRAPDPPRGNPMDRGNSGVLLMGLFEIQIFDSYSTLLYPDGQAAAIYGQAPPLVNATRRSGAWQSYDIVFLAPRFNAGKMEEPARVTVFHNGVLVHHNQEIYGAVAHAALPKPYPAGVTMGPLVLTGHRNPVRFRNIWIRPLPKAAPPPPARAGASS